QNMRALQIEVVVRSVEIGRDGGNEIRAVLARISLAKFHAGYFSDGISVVGRLERAAQQGAFRNWLRRMLWINARAAKEKKFAHTALIRRLDDAVLNTQIIEQKFDGEIAIRFDAAHFSRRENHDCWFFPCEKRGDRALVCQVELSAV